MQLSLMSCMEKHQHGKLNRNNPEDLQQIRVFSAHVSPPQTFLNLRGLVIPTLRVQRVR